MSKKLYVGNLSYNVDEESLREMFAKIGEVQSVKIITDVATGRSKGFGFVEMTSDEDSKKAIDTLNGTSLMERNITVSEARPQTEKGGQRGGRGSGPGGGFGRGGGGGRQRFWR
ncbi:MAG: RNA-binding protein [Thermodesulfovibrionales bacterium]|nr:RNA-binding protein [Thermodesulfovibrionales bacterium]